eukprot:scaffold42537_cov44-Cyclotella_meneghiniana.AAC.1
MLEWRAHYTEWLDGIEAAQPGLNQRVLCVYLGRRVDRIAGGGTGGAIIMKATLIIASLMTVVALVATAGGSVGHDGVSTCNVCIDEMK